MKKNKLIKEAMKIKTEEDFESAPKEVQEFIQEMRDRVSNILQTETPTEIENGIRKAFENSDSIEEFHRLTMVGDCPKCGSSKTRDCEDSPLGDSCVGICLDCAVLWCLECGQVFEEGIRCCDHWPICEACKFIDENKEKCTANISPMECSIIKEERKKGS